MSDKYRSEWHRRFARIAMLERHMPAAEQTSSASHFLACLRERRAGRDLAEIRAEVILQIAAAALLTTEMKP